MSCTCGVAGFDERYTKVIHDSTCPEIAALVDKAVEERTRVLQECADHWGNRAEEHQQHAMDLEAEKERLRALVEKLVEQISDQPHNLFCPSGRHPEKACSCGRDEALASAEGVTKMENPEVTE